MGRCCRKLERETLQDLLRSLSLLTTPSLAPHLTIYFKKYFLGMPFRSKRPNKPKGYWGKRANRRSYFIEFAQRENFDPFDVQKWYDVTGRKIAAEKVSPFFLFIWLLMPNVV